jgi:hypothetical protein
VIKVLKILLKKNANNLWKLSTFCIVNNKRKEVNYLPNYCIGILVFYQALSIKKHQLYQLVFFIDPSATLRITKKD